MPSIRVPVPSFIQRYVDRSYLDVSLIRLLPLTALMTFGVLAGLVFNTGVGHPYDKIIHIGFYALLTLSIHTLFGCRLRLSAAVAFSMGVGGEIVQAFVPHHEASMADAFANGIGVALVVAAIALLRSEEKQALKEAPVEIDYYSTMGLEPYRSRTSSPEAPSSRTSEK
ncbi:antibiotic resistance protein VanZ [Roseibium limicola]|uniref:Antibiotic resistance protein VanZ n=1 Tax=Roseibium limicola TaxID=2816037 RepID=A0A939JB67_9HYPH|nr:antibiotic resistance protein VanZ [Roseibium limicola]